MPGWGIQLAPRGRVMAQPRGSSRSTLAELVHARAGEIIRLWTERSRGLARGRGGSGLALIDHLPEVLEWIARALDGGGEQALGEEARRDALERLARGFQLGEIIEEYDLLHRCILHACGAEMVLLPVVDVERLAAAVHRALEDSAVQLAAARERSLRALDRIGEAAVASPDVERFLQQLIEVILDTTPAVHFASVLLRHGDTLRVAAVAGSAGEDALGRTLRVGEGFAGRVAAAGRPLFVSDASRDLAAASPIFARAGVRALYGVPLAYDGAPIGVATMGSRTAFEYSDEDKLLFETMSNRATLVVAQHQALERVAAAEERVRLAVEATELGTWDWHLRSDSLEWSEQARLIFGLDPLQAPERDAVRACVHPDDLPLVDRAVDQARDPSGDGRFAIEYRIFRADDRALRWLSARGRVRFDAQRRALRMVGTVLDVTERKQSEEGQRFLSEASDTLASGLDSHAALEQITRLAVPRLADWCTVALVTGGAIHTVAVAHVDPQKVALARSLDERFPADPSLPVGVAAVLKSARPALVADVSDEALRTAVPSNEQLAALRELGVRSYLGVPLIARDQVLGAISFVMAGSGRRYGARDLEVAQHLARRAALAIDNARLYEEARHATRLREQVMAVVSHDLKSPLGAIQLAATALETRLPDGARAPRPAELERQRRQLEVIRRATRRMDHLIRDLLDVAGIQAGRLVIDARPEPIGEVVEEALAGQRPLAAERTVRLEAELGAGDTVVRADRARVLQVLDNLIGNALKFCRPGDRVTVATTLGARDVVVAVRDTGPGITEADREHIFDAYWSGARHGKHGTGLGLAISRGLVEAHGGRLWVESELGAGSAFYFTLPTV